MLPKNTKEKLEEPKGKITIKSDIDLKKNKKELLIWKTTWKLSLIHRSGSTLDRKELPKCKMEEIM